MDFIKSNKVWIGLGACVVAIIGNFLPFFSITFLGAKQNGISFFEGDGKIVIAAFVAAGVLIYLKKDFKIILGLLAIGLGLTIYDGINVANVATGSYYGSVNLSIGFYLIIIGGAIAAAVQFIKSEETSVTNNFANQEGFVSYTTQPSMNQSMQPQYNSQQIQQPGFNQYGQPMPQQYNNQQMNQPMNQGFNQPYNNQQPAQQNYQQQYNNQGMQQGYGQPYNNQQQNSNYGQNYNNYNQNH